MAEAPGMHNPLNLPPDIPVPQDDGAADHLTGLRLPDLALSATSGAPVNLSALEGRTVLYIYPRTGVPGVDLPQGWNEIPGARGCTPQSCGFRDHFAEMKRLGVAQVFGLSTQDTAYQQEAASSPASAVPDPLRRKARLRQGAQLAHLQRGRHEPIEAHGAGDRRRDDHQGVLPGVSTRQERGRRGGLDSGVQIGA